MPDGHHHHHPHSHGRANVGRVIIGAGCLLVLAANALLFKAASQPKVWPMLRVIAVGTLIWMFTAAGALCMRKGWGRGLVLAILYAGSFGYFMTGMITLAGDESGAGKVKPLLIATGVYLFVSLVFTKSRNVCRLTSRMWE